jgi:hypothetical protein
MAQRSSTTSPFAVPARAISRVVDMIARPLQRPILIRGRQWNPFRTDAFYWGNDEPGLRQGMTLGAIFQILLMIVFSLPIAFGGCAMDGYFLPKGRGMPRVTVEQVQVVKPKKKPRMLINPNSPISFERPDIDDSTLREEVEKKTENQYVAGKLSKLGAGGEGEGGWPDGMAGAKIRFIRLMYEGGDWDQDMGVDSDYNMLLYFQKHSGFNIAENTEAIPVQQLRRFDPPPPFVYITGRGGIRMTTAEMKTLRWYCLERGGMIFADNGGGSFNSSFRSLMSQVFPEYSLVSIPFDDIIFQEPVSLPNGAPPLWHHSGNEALGIKHHGRWIVFYHQGDINDAWKTGHSGAKPSVAEQAYAMGLNVMYYAFTQSYAINSESYEREAKKKK